MKKKMKMEKEGRKEEGGRRKEEGGRRKEEGGRRKKERGRREEEGGRRKEKPSFSFTSQTLIPSSFPLPSHPPILLCNPIILSPPPLNPNLLKK
ncbi:unnamed protein product [Brugia pahangi]|uniref:Uncharacterized protein n=1 Tax=Brugia pahangi TaxID=6280 RepID=A0A0N4T1F8_BRUPA|nr:unnamed protein product [Brugia pahangi]